MTKHKRQTKVIIAINWLNKISYFSSKLITNTITILNIHYYIQKGNKEKKKEKERRVGMIIPR